MKTVLTAHELQAGVDRLAAKLNARWGDRPVLMVGVLGGAFIFLADLVRRLDMPIEIGFVRASSYRGQTTRPGELTTSLEGLPAVRGRHVVLVDDIFDSGLTLDRVSADLWRDGPASLETVVLLLKQGRAQVAMRPDHVVFEIPDAFVVGYGLDYDGLFRNLPELAALEPHELPQPDRRGE